MRDLVCLYDLGAELGKHPGDCRLATGDPAGQADFQQACLSVKSRREHYRRLNLKRRRVPARPMAATRMSARRHTPGRSRVFEWQTVTVALPLISSIATGLPTISLRPTTTASWPAIGMPLRLRISMIPAGVHGTKPGRCVERKPTFTG